MSARKTLVIETGQIFKSQKELAAWLGKPRAWVADVLNGRCENDTQYTFLDIGSKKPIRNTLHMVKPDPDHYEVRYGEHVLRTFSHRYLAELYMQSSAREDILERFSNIGNWRESMTEESSGKRLYKRVRCIETGEIFPTKAAASIWLGKYKRYLGRVFSGKIKNRTPYTFEMIEVEE